MNLDQYDLTPVFRALAHAFIALTWIAMFSWIAGVVAWKYGL